MDSQVHRQRNARCPLGCVCSCGRCQESREPEKGQGGRFPAACYPGDRGNDKPLHGWFMQSESWGRGMGGDYSPEGWIRTHQTGRDVHEDDEQPNGADGHLPCPPLAEPESSGRSCRAFRFPVCHRLYHQMGTELEEKGMDQGGRRDQKLGPDQGNARSLLRAEGDFGVGARAQWA